MITNLAIFIVGLVAVFILLNLFLSTAFRFFPSLIVTPEERERHRYMARFEGDLRPYVADWFGVPEVDWPAFRDEYERHELNIYEHEPFCEFRHPQRSGRFINYSAEGFRHGADQGPWPATEDHFNIWFFGGSTALNVGPDWTCVPSRLQAYLNEHGAGPKPIRVYNFGRGSYFSSMEAVLFANLLREGFRCDMAVFFDGINDSFFYNGLPPTHGIFRQAIQDMNAEISSERRHRLRASPKWRELWKFLGSLPLMRALDIAASHLAHGNRSVGVQALSEPPPLSGEEIEAVIARYRNNRRMIESICHSYKIAPVFVWQPTPSYGYDVEHHIALPYHGGLQGHGRSGQVTETLSECGAFNDDSNAIWLADIQNETAEPLYVDTVHYTDEFMQSIAEVIGSTMIERGLLAAARRGANRASTQEAGSHKASA